MKISRLKKSQKILSFFATNFNYHQPYQILIDATFCQAALKHKVIIEEQLQKYFQLNIKLLTTQCIILEAESLGAQIATATQIVKKFMVHKCGHEGNPVTAGTCIKSMNKQGRYIVASQDRELQNSLRKVPGRCLLYLHNATPVLEGPSDASQKYVLKKSAETMSDNLKANIEKLKKSHGLPTKSSQYQPVKKFKRAKNPNPLSCKKSKKQKTSSSKNALKTSMLNKISDKSKMVKKAKKNIKN